MWPVEADALLRTLYTVHSQAIDLLMTKRAGGTIGWFANELSA